MSVLDSFATFQTAVNASPDSVGEARRRRRIFESAFLAEDDVLEVVPSGSLARGTHKDPIHDVDLIVIYDRDAHPEWGGPGASAAEALDHTRSRVNTLLGATNGERERLVRLARWRNHAVKCFLDDPDDPQAFTVDVMPAFRLSTGIEIPEVMSQSWVQSDPERLISDAANRHEAWTSYSGTVRMLKRWANDQPIKIKSLVMEVLALNYLPTGPNYAGALTSFFTRAAYAIENGSLVEDPADLSGEIQSDLDYDTFAELLRESSDKASQAIDAQADNNSNLATTRWNDVFGEEFPIVAAAPGVASDTGPRPVKDTPQG